MKKISAHLETEPVLVSHAQFLSLVYHDLFSYPLDERELWFWQLGVEKMPRHKVFRSFSFFHLKNRKNDAMRRFFSSPKQEKWKLAHKASEILSRIPTVCLVGISGSLAVGNAVKSDDVDLFVVTSVDCLWITRLVSIFLLWFLRIPVRRYGQKEENKICLNLWLDQKHLSFADKKDVYIAHEILQAKILFDRDFTYRRFLIQNRWTRRFFPNAFSYCMEQAKNYPFSESFKIIFFLRFFEAPARVLQKKYMVGKKTKEHISNGEAFFHPVSWRDIVPQAFLSRLERILKNQEADSTVSPLV